MALTRRQRRFRRETPTWCPTGKVVYGTPARAEIALLDVQRANGHGRTGRHEQRIYRCLDCRRWHLTSKAKHRPPAPLKPPATEKP